MSNQTQIYKIEPVSKLQFVGKFSGNLKGNIVTFTTDGNEYMFASNIKLDSAERPCIINFAEDGVIHLDF